MVGLLSSTILNSLFTLTTLFFITGWVAAFWFCAADAPETRKLNARKDTSSARYLLI